MGAGRLELCLQTVLRQKRQKGIEKKLNVCSNPHPPPPSVRNFLVPTPGIAKKAPFALQKPGEHRTREQLPHSRRHRYLSKSLLCLLGMGLPVALDCLEFRFLENQKTDRSFPERYTAPPSYSTLQSRGLSVALQQGLPGPAAPQCPDTQISQGRPPYKSPFPPGGLPGKQSPTHSTQTHPITDAS